MLLPPQNLSATASHGYVQLDWDAPVSGVPDSYKIYRNGNILTSTPGTGYTDAAVSDGTTYQYYLTAVYDGAESPATQTVSATPNMYPPTNLAAIPGNALVDLNWTAAEGRQTHDGFSAAGSKDRIISSYRIYRNGMPITTVTGTSYRDTGLTNGNTYSYYVTTLYSNPAGESAPSNTVTASPNMISEVVIGTGTSSTYSSAACPINITFKSLHGQSVYTAAELNALGVVGPAYITGLAFWVDNSPIHSLPDFMIRMKHTTDTNATNWQGVSEMVTVFSSDNYMPAAGDWDMLNFQTPFLWNGTRNIVVDTAFGLTEAWNWSGTVRYSSMSNGYRMTRDDYLDQTNVFAGDYTSSYRPNVKLLLIPYQTGPEIAIDPLSLAFGEVETGSSSVQQFTITNSGDSPLTGSITTPTNYTVSESAARTDSLNSKAGKPALADAERNMLNFSIPAGSYMVYNLSFAPTAAAAYNGNVVINSNDSDEGTIHIAVTGSGINLPLTIPVVTISRSGNNRLLSWPAVANATGYQVWSASTPDGSYSLLTPTPIIAVTYTDIRNLPMAFYKVTAVRN